MSMTYFHFIKTNGRYGLIGNDRNYATVLLPDVALSRTKVREKLEKSYLLERSVEILAQLLQMEKYMSQYQTLGLMCTPQELYDDIKALGYDWNTLLNSRGWWTIDQYRKDRVPFLSPLDLLKMRKEVYHPYWLEKDKTTVKKEWVAHFTADV